MYGSHFWRSFLPRAREEGSLPACQPLWASLRIAVKSSPSERRRWRTHLPRELPRRSILPPSGSLSLSLSLYSSHEDAPGMHVLKRAAKALALVHARKKWYARVTHAAACHKDSCLPLASRRVRKRVTECGIMRMRDVTQRRGGIKLLRIVSGWDLSFPTWILMKHASLLNFGWN